MSRLSLARVQVNSLRLGLAIVFTSTVLAGAGLAAPAPPHAPAADPGSAFAGGPPVQGTLAVKPVPVLGSSVVDVAELMRREARVPSFAKPPERVLELERNERDEDGDFESRNDRGVVLNVPFVGGTRLDVASPSPSWSFAGLDDIAMVDSSYIIIPPDVNGAVGPTRIFQNLNNNVRILDKTTGAVLSTVGVNTFWAATGASPNNYTDPRSAYDPYNGRFITIMQGDLDRPTGNTICLGVSDTNDPSGTWHLYRFTAYENATYQYADFPTLGFNKNWVTISINMYNSTQTAVRRSVFMVHYPTLRNSFAATVFRADYATSSVLCGSPCITYSATCDTEYVVQRRGTSTYSVDMITGSGPSAPTYVVGAAITRPGGTWNAAGTSNYYPQSAPVSGASACGATPCAIERSDDNVRTPSIYRGGSIWFTQQVALPSVSPTHMAVQWTQLTTPSFATVAGGRLQDTLATTTNGRPHYGEPSIAVNGNGDFLLGFTRFGSMQHPGAGYAIHMASDGVGTLRDTVIYQNGLDYYHKTFTTTTGRNRWGDFSTTQVDPSDDLTFWTVQEYAKTRVGTNDGNTGTNSSKWGTWWAGVTPTASFVITASAGTGGSIAPAGAVSVTQGANQSFSITANACFAIADVLVDGVSQGAIPSYTFTNVQGAHSISASFSALGPYAITATAGAGGSISPAGVTPVACGASQGYAITPDPNHHVVDVLVDGVSQGAITGHTFTNVQAVHTISASFALDTWTITASAGANGAISPSGAVSVNAGSDQAFAMTPDPGYYLAGLVVDGGAVAPVSPYTFTNVVANHTIAASYSNDAAVFAAGSSATAVGPDHPCEAIPVTLTRSDGLPVLGYRLNVQLSAELAACNGVASIVERDFLSAAGTTSFVVVDHGGGSYTVSDSLTSTCGATATSDTLFTIDLTGAAGAAGTGTITLSSLSLLDCTSTPMVAQVGAAGSLPVDFQTPLVTVGVPNGGESVNVGDPLSINWTATDNLGVTGITVLLSRTGSAGAFDTLASGLANTPPYAWTVTGPTTADGWMRVVARDALGNAGTDVSDAAFTIGPTAGVDAETPVAFALLPVSPNPARGGGSIEFALPREASIRLSVVDLQGREVALLANGVLAAGLHHVRWNGQTASGPAGAGVYFVSYRTPERHFVRRMVLMR